MSGQLSLDVLAEAKQALKQLLLECARTATTDNADDG